ncbi:MAG TPA: S49 family peptidase [Proteobacteria bacterium]|nr:S49 family peptidase [Pseudomonadota bacterium]
MENIGTSAAYYIASAANRIVLNPGTFTGSIGVIYVNFNMADLYRWMKVEPEVLKSGRFKDTGSTFRPMTEDERKLLKGLLEQVHRQFIEDVSKGRGLEVEEVRKIADGRVITGEQAIELGLADGFGNLNDAVKLAAELAGIEGEPRVIYPKRKFEWHMLFEAFSDAVVDRLLKTGSIPLYRYGIGGGEVDE